MIYYIIQNVRIWIVFQVELISLIYFIKPFI